MRVGVRAGQETTADTPPAAGTPVGAGAPARAAQRASFEPPAAAAAGAAAPARFRASAAGSCVAVCAGTAAAAGAGAGAETPARAAQRCIFEPPDTLGTPGEGGVQACAGCCGADASLLSNLEVTGASMCVGITSVVLAVPLGCDSFTSDVWSGTAPPVACRAPALAAQRASLEAPASGAGASAFCTAGVESNLEMTGASSSADVPASATPFAGGAPDGEPFGDAAAAASLIFSRCSCSCCLSLLTHLSRRFLPLPGLLLRS